MFGLKKKKQVHFNTQYNITAQTWNTLMHFIFKSFFKVPPLRILVSHLFFAHLFLIVLLRPRLFIPCVGSATLSDCFIAVISSASQFLQYWVWICGIFKGFLQPIFWLPNQQPEGEAAMTKL